MEDCDEDTEKQNRRPGCSSSLKNELRKGWLQLVAVFGVNMLLVGYSRSFGVIYIILREVYGSSATATTWVSGLQTLLRMALGPVGSMLIKRWSVRPVCLVGACILAAGAICSSFANSLAVMYITYAVMIGLGGCVVYVGNYLVIATNFENHRMFAFGMSNIGYSVGIFLFPILSDILIEQYSFQGYLLIFGGLLANVIVCAALFKTNTKDQSENVPENESNEIPEDSHKLPTVHISNGFKSVSLPEIPTNDSKEEKYFYKECSIKNSLTNNYRIDTFGSAYITYASTEIPCDIPHIRKTSGSLGDLNDIQIHRTLSEPSLVKPETDLQKCVSYRALISNPLFVNLCIATTCQTMTFGVFYAFIKALAIENQIENGQATFLLSLSGLTDLLGNLILSPIADLAIVKPRRTLLYVFISVVYAIGFMLYPFGDTFPKMIVLVFVNGMISSQVHTARLAVALDIIQSNDPDLMSIVIGCLTFSMGTGHALSPTVGGLLVDTSGGYVLSFYVAGLCLAVVSFLLGFLILFCKNKKPHSYL